MKFDLNVSSGSNQGLCQDARYLCGLQVNDTGSYPKEDLTRNINAWYRKVNSWIWNATGKWEYDDTNYSTLPIATTTLVDGQQDYSLPSTAQKVMRVEVKNSSGDYIQLEQIDQTEITSAMSEFYETAGMPAFYDLIGDSIMLYPKPDADDVTTSAGLKVFFSRDISEFTVNSTGTDPGFIDDFHRALSMGAALDYCFGKGLTDRVVGLREQIALMKEDIANYYSVRNVQKRIKIYPSDERIVGYL